MNLLTIQSFKDGTKARSFLSYASRDEALAELYNTMSASVSDTNVVNVICEILGDDGSVIRKETYTRVYPVEVTETEPLNKEG